MKLTITCLLVALAAFAASAHPTEQQAVRKLYNGDKVLRILPTTEDHVKWLSELHQSADPNVHDFWSEPRGVNVPVDLHINREAMHKFHADCQAQKLNYTVGIADLQALIDETEAPMLERQRREARRLGWLDIFGGSSNTNNRASIVGTFARYNDIVSFLTEMCATYPTLTSCGTLGKTYEKRDMHYIKIGSNTGTNKKIIFIEAGIHAREWLAPATTVYIINRLLTTYNTDASAKTLIDTYDFIIVPSANPDGYEYSRTERMWRKNRSKQPTSSCYGTDPNRNYDVYWGSSGSSSSPCSDIYKGPSAFSEPETKALSDFIKERKDKILAFFAIHTYSQMWLIPYADKRNHYAPNFDELLRVAKIGTNALMAVNNKKWDAGNTVEVLSAAAGGSDDWAVYIGIKYSYTLELRPASTALNGFVVNESEIDPSGREVWAGLVAAIKELKA